MCHPHRVQRPIQLLHPECQKTPQLGKFWEEIVVLPDIGLEQPTMVRPPIQNMRGCQAVTQSLFAKILRNHRTTVSDSKIAFQHLAKAPKAACVQHAGSDAVPKVSSPFDSIAVLEIVGTRSR